MRIWSLVTALCFAAAPGWAEERISGLLRSMADGGPVPTEKVFYVAVDDDYVNLLSPDSVKDFLPLAGKLLGDSRPEVRKYGLVCFLAVTFRRSLDSELLLEPYVPDLLRLASDRTSPLWTIATQVVGNTWPRLSPKTIAFLSAHLADKDNTAEDTARIACTLFRVGSDALIHDVFTFLRKQEDKPNVVVNVLLGLHALPPTRNADILAFIGSSLDSPDASVRNRAVEVVAGLRMAERAPFLTQLNRMSTDPNEPTEIRTVATEVLKQK